MKIAVFVDRNGNTLPFYETGTVELYDRDGSRWYCKNKIPFGTDEKMRLSQIRSIILEMVYQIEDCKIFIAKTIKGLPYTIFEGLGISIWKLDGAPTGFLDYVMEQEEKIKIDKLKSKPAPTVVGDFRDGVYKFDLAAALAGDSSLTSKQLLIPFFQKTAFQTLEITCEHIPRWFEKEFDSLKLGFRIEESNDGRCHAIVFPAG